MYCSCLIFLAVPLTQSQQAFHQTMIYEKVQMALISLQAEKSFYRDRMLNEYVRLKEKKQPQTVDDFMKLKQ